MTVEVSTRIDAAPERVWTLVGDPTRMGEWSPECKRVTWSRGATGPFVGARFRGHNRQGWRHWSTSGVLVTLDPNREIAWDVSVAIVPIARWTYRLEADGDGCTLTESFEDKRGALAKSLGRPVRGVTDVDAHNRRGMQATLERIKAAAEGPQT